MHPGYTNFPDIKQLLYLLNHNSSCPRDSSFLIKNRAYENGCTHFYAQRASQYYR